MNAQEQLQRMMISADVESAYEALEAGQYGAALMALNSAEEKLKILMEALEAEKAAKIENMKKQFVIDLKP